MHSSSSIRCIALFVLILLFPAALWAYVGPGAGISLLGAIGAVLAAIFFAVTGILLWPIRALLKKKKMKAAETQEAVQETKPEN